MSIIKSARKFGVEIEFSTPNEEAFNSIRKRLPIERDGSLRGLSFPGEYVSPVFVGDKGAANLTDACDILKQYGAESTSEQTSVHVHLDAGKTEGTLRSSRRKPDSSIVSNSIVIGISNRLKSYLSVSSIHRALLNRRNISSSVQYSTSQFGKVTFYSKVELTREPLINYTYYWIEPSDRFKFLQNVLYFYTQYSDVMEAIVSNSRQFGNMYCIPLSKSYNLEDIAKCKTEKELYDLWYKGRSMGGDFDDSRYHNVNLHSFWHRPGTIEIRSHGGTIDPNKILLWVRLHQTIVDKLETMNLNDIKFIDDGGAYALHKSFIKFVDDELLSSYIKRLLGYYSDISLK